MRGSFLLPLLLAVALSLLLYGLLQAASNPPGTFHFENISGNDSSFVLTTEHIVVDNSSNGSNGSNAPSVSQTVVSDDSSNATENVSENPIVSNESAFPSESATANEIGSANKSNLTNGSTASNPVLNETNLPEVPALSENLSSTSAANESGMANESDLTNGSSRANPSASAAGASANEPSNRSTELSNDTAPLTEGSRFWSDPRSDQAQFHQVVYPTPASTGSVYTFQTAHSLNELEYIYLPRITDLVDPNTGDFTAAIWFKTGSHDAPGTLFYYGSLRVGRFYLARLNSEGTVFFSVGDETTSIELETNQSYNDNRWHLLVVGRNGEQVYILVDGQLQSDQKILPINLSSYDASLSVGADMGDYPWSNTPRFQFSGDLSRPLFWARNLSSREIGHLSRGAP